MLQVVPFENIFPNSWEVVQVLEHRPWEHITYITRHHYHLTQLEQVPSETVTRLFGRPKINHHRKMLPRSKKHGPTWLCQDFGIGTFLIHNWNELSHLFRSHILSYAHYKKAGHICPDFTANQRKIHH